MKRIFYVIVLGSILSFVPKTNVEASFSKKTLSIVRKMEEQRKIITRRTLTMARGEQVSLEVGDLSSGGHITNSCNRVASVSSDGILSATKSGVTYVRVRTGNKIHVIRVFVKPHTHVFEEEIIRESTCTNNGKVKRVCACGQTKVKTTNKKEHLLSDWIVTQEATYSSKGERVIRCQNCENVIQKEVTPKLQQGNTVDTYENCREQMLAMVNDEREKAGLKPLELFEPINATAQEKAVDMYETSTFNHKSEKLGYFYNQYNKTGLVYIAGGENIARGCSTVESVMEGWMNSEGHKANILGEYYTHIGIGYYKGYWVQQFIGEPKLGKTMPCSKCDSLVNISQCSFTTKDWEGNVYNIYQCKNCGKMIEKCPKCEMGFFQEVGITARGTKAHVCDTCGHHESATCIETCRFCDEKVLGNTRYIHYIVSLDSTKSYNGEDYEKVEGCYFQAFAFDSVICNSCNKCIIGATSSNNYALFCEKLKAKVGEEDIYEYIFWQKVVGHEVVSKEGNYTVLREIREFVTTPRIQNMNELEGLNELQ